MPRTALTPITPKGPFPGTVNAGDLASAFTALDNTNGNSYPFTGKEILVFNNPDASAHTITLTSVADPQSRKGDITAYSLPATSFASFYPGTGNPAGWQQSDGNFYIDCNSNLIKVLVLRLP